MADVIIYTTKSCPYCQRAKQLLDTKKIPYTEIDVTTDDVKREEMMKKSNARSVPQIFIKDKSIGGFNELWELNTKGALDELLSGE